MLVAFWGPTLCGHTIASWEYADGSHLAVSIEIRKGKGEAYSALRGFSRQYGLYYVVAEERDLTTLRTNDRGERVHLYRIGRSVKGQDLLLDYVSEINAIAERRAGTVP